MLSAKIYHVSRGRAFPLDTRERGAFRLHIQEVPPTDIAKIQPDSDRLPLLLIQCEAGDTAEVIQAVEAAKHLESFPRLYVVPRAEYDVAARSLSLAPMATAIDDGVRPANLKALLELSLRIVYYRDIVQSLGREMREREGIFDKLMGLAREELRESKAESEAFRTLAEYESQHRESESRTKDAMELAMSLKDQEMLTLKDQLEAVERLSEYRHLELRDARQTIEAAEAVLDLSQKENIEREQLISALDRLRMYTDQELLELFQENQQLRRQLGLEPLEPI